MMRLLPFVLLLGAGCAGADRVREDAEPQSPARLFGKMIRAITSAESVRARVTVVTVRSGVPGTADVHEEVEAEVEVRGAASRVRLVESGRAVETIPADPAALLYELARFDVATGTEGPRRESPPTFMEYRRLGRECVQGEVAEKVQYMAVIRRGGEPRAQAVCTVWISVDRGLPLKREKRYAWRKSHAGTHVVTETFHELELGSTRGSAVLALGR